MAPVKSRSVASGALALVGLMAAGVAVIWKTSDNQSGSVADAPATELAAPEPELDPSLFTPPDKDPELLQRRGVIGEDIEQKSAALQTPDRTMAAPKLAAPEIRRDMLQSQKQSAASETGPIEFIVKLKDKRLSGELRDTFQFAPDKAARRLKHELGGGGLMEGARLQGFTLGGEAILRWEGPARIVDYGARQAEIQRALRAAPGVSYAEQNYTADLQSAQ
jgi:hypothetical protein